MRKIMRILTVVFVFVFVLALLACSPRTAGTDSEDTGFESSEESNGDALVAAELTWTPESDCAMCHENSVTSLASLTCEATHADNPDDTCTTCHTDVSGMGTAHSGVTLADTTGDVHSLKKTKISEDACLSCHILDELIVATQASTVLTDSEGLTVNPHEVNSVYNVGNSHSSLICSSCHKMHSDKPVEDNASQNCRSCHHQDVYECGTCH
jgi:hypothetical protein